MCPVFLHRIIRMVKKTFSDSVKRQGKCCFAVLREHMRTITEQHMENPISFKETDYINRRVVTMNGEEGIIYGERLDAQGRIILKVKLVNEKEVEGMPERFCFI